jgi:hypothetical protein
VFTRQQCVRERAAKLHYTYTAYLFCRCNFYFDNKSNPYINVFCYVQGSVVLASFSRSERPQSLGTAALNGAIVLASDDK